MARTAHRDQVGRVIGQRPLPRREAGPWSQVIDLRGQADTAVGMSNAAASTVTVQHGGTGGPPPAVAQGGGAGGAGPRGGLVCGAVALAAHGSVGAAGGRAVLRGSR